MFYVTIDCGTTNSRAYVVDENGKIYGKAAKRVGVRDTAILGSNKKLVMGIKEIIKSAILESGIQMLDVEAVFSSGMITSEVGLYEIPHLMAPCGVDELAENITLVVNLDIVPDDIPVYFVCGIKNRMNNDFRRSSEKVGELDFMRGEETQIIGMLAKEDVKLPVMVVILSSHTKFVPVSKDRKILGSLTTMSGQMYDAILNNTFVGKSVEKRNNEEEVPNQYFDEKVVEDAIYWVNKGGMVRACMFPRFMDVLLDTKWYERALFFESLIAAEDMLSIGSIGMFCDEMPKEFVLIGKESRCKIYEYIIKKNFNDVNVSSVSDADGIDDLGIKGILTIARKAGIINV